MRNLLFEPMETTTMQPRMIVTHHHGNHVSGGSAIPGWKDRLNRPASTLACLLLGAIVLAAGCASSPPGGETEVLQTEVPVDQPVAEIPSPIEPLDAPPEAPSDNSAVEEPRSAADLIERLRRGFSLPDTPDNNALVQSHINWYAKHPEYIDRVFTRSTPYLYFIATELEQRNMPLEFALLPIVESAYDPFAYSHGRAAGLWQFIPGTGRHFGLRQNWWYDGRRDVIESTRAALDYLERLYQRFDGDWFLAIAAYNSGEGHIGRALKNNAKRGRPLDLWHLQLRAETRHYVPKLLALRALVAEPQLFGLTLPVITNAGYFGVVDTHGQIDLALAADLAQISLDELYVLNPGFNRWATDPEGPHRLLVPVSAVQNLSLGLANLPAEERVQWQRYRIRQGDSLIRIAKRHHTTVEVLRETNGLGGSLIRAGQYLLIPNASKPLQSYSLSADARLDRTRNTPRSGNRTTYVVQHGDSLWQIAQTFNVDVRRLAKWNGMAPRDTLSVGRELVIWTQSSERSTLPASRTLRRIQYTVRPGDSLSRISSKFNVSVTQLRDWNSSARGKYLKPGQKLVVYVNVTDQASGG